MCFYCVNINRMFRSSRAAAIDGCCVTAALKQAESNRSEQNQATQPEPDGSYRSLKTRTRTRAETRNTSWIKQLDPTRKLPGPKPGLKPVCRDVGAGVKPPQYPGRSPPPPPRVSLHLTGISWVFCRLFSG